MKTIKNWDAFNSNETKKEKKSPWKKKDYKPYYFFVEIESPQIVGEGDVEEALSILEKTGASDITVNKLSEWDLERLYGGSDSDDGSTIKFPPSGERE